MFELWHGIYRAKTPDEAVKRAAFVRRVSQAFPIYPLTEELAENMGRVEVEMTMRGKTLPFEDLAIGVTALSFGFDVVTLNLRDFQMIPGLKVVAWEVTSS